MAKTDDMRTDAPTNYLDAALKAAALGMVTPITGPEGRKFLLRPGDFAIQELPDASRLGPFAKAQIEVDDRPSLSNYANRFCTARSIIVADIDKGTISVKVDYHSESDRTADEASMPGAGVHSATLVLRPSEEYKRWDAIEGQLLPQGDFARFLEENAVDILDPDAATMIEISRDMEATSGQKYTSSVRLDNGDRRVTFESETRARSDLRIPQRFSLSIPLWHGEEPVEINALFRWRAQGVDGILLGFQWHRVEYVRRAQFNLLAFTAAEETGLPVYFGRMKG